MIVGDSEAILTVEQGIEALLDAESIEVVARVLLALVLPRVNASSGRLLLLHGSELLLIASSPSYLTGKAAVARLISQGMLDSDELECLKASTDVIMFRVKSSVEPICKEILSRSAWIPLRHRRELIGVLYLEAADAGSVCDPQAIGSVSMFARQAASSLAYLRTSGALIEEARLRRDAEESRQAIYDSMLKHQRIGKMGDFRFNTRTLTSTGSQETYRMAGFEEDTAVVEYDAWMARLHPNDRLRVHEEMAAAFAKRLPLRFGYRIIVDGEVRHIHSEGHPEFDRNGDLLYCGVVVDITEQKAAEHLFATMQAELSNALRLASMGELAGSVVHEVNQPLTAMITNADACRRWLLRDVPNIAEALDAADQVVQDGQRTLTVTRGLDDLARGAQISLEPLQLRDIVSGVMSLMRIQLERNGILTRLEFMSMSDILGDRTQLQQIIYNIVRNAIEAMAHVHDRPRLMVISVRETEGAEVITSIRDNGHGFDLEPLDSVFDSLRTTKDEGWGMGLSICRRIIRAHHGRIWAERNNDAGLTIKFAIPMGWPRTEQPAPIR